MPPSPLPRNRFRAGFGWFALAVLGLVIAAGVSLAASRLSSQHIGLSSEPLSAGQQLSPVETTTTTTEHRTKRTTRTTNTRTTQSARPPQAGAPTITRSVTTPPQRTTDDRGGGGGSDDHGGHGSDD